MGRKVFISVLGATPYRECVYMRGDYKSNSVRFIQEATLEYFNNIEKWTSSDFVYILLTKEAEEKNWKDRVDTDNLSKIEGLESRLKNLNSDFTIEPITNLPHGNSEDEIWIIFEHVFSKIEDGDELYFDLTYGFRYLPMLVMVLINYTKVLRNTIVKSISYGNFESRNSANEAPIVDLLSLSALQDWTNAAAQYLDGGSVNRLMKVSAEKLNPILKESRGANQDAKKLKSFLDSLKFSINDMQTCRGINIVENVNIEPLKNRINDLGTTFIAPLNPIFDKIKESFNEFTGDKNVKNGFVAAQWCMNNGMYQQAITILQENIVTMFCVLHGLDYKVENQRKIVNIAFYYKSKNVSKDTLKCTEKEFEKVEEIIKTDSFEELVTKFDICTSIRNDINHSGMRNNPTTSDNIIKKIKALIDDVQKITSESLSIEN